MMLYTNCFLKLAKSRKCMVVLLSLLCLVYMLPKEIIEGLYKEHPSQVPDLQYHYNAAQGHNLHQQAQNHTLQQKANNQSLQQKITDQNLHINALNQSQPQKTQNHGLQHKAQNPITRPVLDMAQVRDFFGSDVRVKAVKDPEGGLVERRAEVPYAEQRTGADLMTSIIYNRVPKCASSTVARVVQTLARANGFSYLHSLVYRRPNVSAHEEEVLVRDLGGVPRPWLYDRHVQVMDFTAYQHPMPTYINVVREPIARTQSLYYHMRRHSKDVMPFEDYVRRHEALDTGVIATLRYFCRITECRGGDEQDLLQIAKQNVERYYRVVGIMEDLESFFRLLEHHFPEMFRGAVDVYRTTKPQNVDANRTFHAVTNATRDLLRKQFAQEYEFYEFVKQRLANAKRLADIV